MSLVSFYLQLTQLPFEAQTTWAAAGENIGGSWLHLDEVRRTWGFWDLAISNNKPQKKPGSTGYQVKPPNNG